MLTKKPAPSNRHRIRQRAPGSGYGPHRQPLDRSGIPAVESCVRRSLFAWRFPNATPIFCHYLSSVQNSIWRRVGNLHCGIGYRPAVWCVLRGPATLKLAPSYKTNVDCQENSTVDRPFSSWQKCKKNVQQLVCSVQATTWPAKT